MEFLLVIPSVLLGGLLFYVLWDQGRDRDAYLRAINHAIANGIKEQEQAQKTISEMAERIQRPETPIPPAPIYGPAEEPPEPPPEFLHAGQIYPDEDLDGGPPNG